MQILPTASSSVSALLADVGAVAQPTITNVYGLVIIALAIPLAFYLVHQVLGLMPGRRSRH